MPTTCKIQFDNPKKSFYAGECFSGNISLGLTERKKIHGVYIRIDCVVSSEWSDCDTLYYGSEVYLDMVQYLVGGENDEIHLGPGEFNYDFQFILPPHLPSSVEGEYGKVKYTALVVIHNTSSFWSDKTFKERFTVTQPLNVNDPSLQLPIVGDSKPSSFFSLLCTLLSKPVEIVAHAPVLGYAPNQLINLAIQIDNKGHREIFEFTVELVQVIKCFVYSEKKTERRIVITRRYCECRPNSEDVVHVDFPLPMVRPTETSTTRVKQYYYLRITVIADTCFMNPVLKMPIIIGTHAISYSVQDDESSLSSSCTDPPPACEGI